MEERQQEASPPHELQLSDLFQNTSIRKSLSSNELSDACKLGSIENNLDLGFKI